MEYWNDGKMEKWKGGTKYSADKREGILRLCNSETLKSWNSDTRWL
jgi:hypothetical protein